VSAPAFDAELLPRLYARYACDLRSLGRFEPQMPALGYAMHKEARKVLYLMVRHFAPDVVVEISPKRGLSTLHIALALEHNGHGRVLSFEINYRSIRAAADNVRRNGLAHRVAFHYGDARAEAPRQLAALDGIEFLFLDCDHGADFARWYTRGLFPCVRRGGIIHIDDIMTDPRNFARRRELFPMPPTGEEEEVVRFLHDHSDGYTCFSLADCVQRPAYLDAVRPFGGGDVDLEVGAVARRVRGALGVHTEWNPSLWTQKTAAQEATAVPGPSRVGVRRDPARRLLEAFRRRRLSTMSGFARSPVR
jgi:predicted O-methyltransferase YrrM